MYRDTVAYGLSALSYSLPEVMKVLAEVVWRPQFTVEQVGAPPCCLTHHVVILCAIAKYGVAVGTV